MPTATVERDVAIDRLRAEVARTGVWFVDVPRTASTSLRVELGRSLGPAHGKGNTAEQHLATPQIVPDHMPAWLMRDLLGADLWARTFTFTFVRDPWSRTASMYRWRRRMGHFGAELPFAAYVERLAVCDPVLFRHPNHLRGCSAYVTGPDGAVMVDHVGRFDARDVDLKPVRERLPGVDLGRIATQQGDAAAGTAMGAATIALLGECYAEDVERFGFTPPPVG